MSLLFTPSKSAIFPCGRGCCSSQLGGSKWSWVRIVMWFDEASRSKAGLHVVAVLSRAFDTKARSSVLCLPLLFHVIVPFENMRFKPCTPSISMKLSAILWCLSTASPHCGWCTFKFPTRMCWSTFDRIYGNCLGDPFQGCCGIVGVDCIRFVSKFYLCRCQGWPMWYLLVIPPVVFLFSIF